jgi:cobalt-zinc-cadmium efflux system outer membrane protein
MQARKQAEEFLSHDMTIAQLVQVALLNNPVLQAAFEQIGISKAELTQAGLFKNPHFEGHARFAEGASDVEFLISEDFMSILLMPLKRRVAVSEFKGVKLQVSDAVISLIAEVKTAYYELLAAEYLKAAQSESVKAAGYALELTKRQYDQGNTNAVTLGQQQAFYEEAHIELAQDELAVKTARESLNRLLGLKGQAASAWSIQQEPFEHLPEDPPLEELEDKAIAQRLDYAAVTKQVEALRRNLLTTRLGVIPEATVGFNSERDVDSPRVMGPMWQVEVPVFDWKQAAVSGNQARIRQTEYQRSAFEVRILSDVREAWERIASYRQQAEHYQKTLLPVRRKLIDDLQLHYNYMLKGVYELLQAKREEIQATQSYTETLKHYWIARAELERAVGGTLPQTLASRPSTQETQTVPSGHHGGGNED